MKWKSKLLEWQKIQKEIQPSSRRCRAWSHSCLLFRQTPWKGTKGDFQPKSHKVSQKRLYRQLTPLVTSLSSLYSWHVTFSCLFQLPLLVRS